MLSGEVIPTLFLCFPGACRVGAGCRVDVTGKIVLAGGACVMVADSPAVGGAEATNDPEFFYCRLEKLYGLLIVGGAGAGAGA